MKANGKYTVLEILTEAGVENPEEKVGKVRVRVGGIPVNDPNKVINFQPGTKSVDLIVGDESFNVKLAKESKERVFSEGAREALDAEGQEVNKQVEAIQKAKAEAAKEEAEATE